MKVGKVKEKGKRKNLRYIICKKEINQFLNIGLVVILVVLGIWLFLRVLRMFIFSGLKVINYFYFFNKVQFG